MIEEAVNDIVKNNPRKKILLYIAVILTAVFVILLAYFLFFAPKYCSNLECFQGASANCKRAVYMNEDSISSWKYEILGYSGKECAIKVKLMNVKEGQPGMENLVGYDMTCYATGSVSYPEKDLDSCHGRLKEEMLSLIIEKLHAYVVGNVEEIAKTLYGNATAG